MKPSRVLFASLIALAAIVASQPLGVSDIGIPTPKNVARAASGALGPNVPNGNLATGPYSTGTPPSNYDFGTGDLTGWTNTGTVTVQSGGQDGNYARFDSILASVTSSAFNVPADGQLLTYKTVHTSSGSTCIEGWLLYGTNYASSESLVTDCATSSAGWQTKTINVSNWAGQSIKLKFRGGGATTTGVDTTGPMQAVLPHWDVTGNDNWISAHGTDGPAGTYGRAPNAVNPTSAAFTVPANASTLKYSRRVESSGIYNLLARCAPSYNYCNSVNTIQGYIVINDNASPGNWVEKEVNIADFAGRTIKLEFFNAGVFDWYVTEIVRDSSARAGQGVSVASGTFSHSNTDIGVPGKGIPLEFTRYYGSAPSSNKGAEYAPLGYGWTHSYAMRLTFPTTSTVTVYYPSASNETFTKPASVYIAPPGSYNTLVKNGDNTYTLTTKGDVDYNFGTTGKLTSIVDRNGNTTSLTYDGTSGLLTTVTDPGSRTLAFTYTSGRITQVEDPIDRTVGFEYDSNGDLTEATGVKGGTTTYAYSNHRMTSFTDSLSHEHAVNVLDTYSRVVEQEDSLGGIGCYYHGQGPSHTSSNCAGVSPSPSAGQTVYVDPRGKKSTYDFDETFRTTQITTHDGDVAAYDYDSNFNVTCVTDPLGHKTAYAYDSKGNVTEMIDSNNTNSSCQLASGGAKWTYTYTSRNDVDLTTDPRGNKIDYVYDSNGNVTEVQRKDSSNSIKLRTCFTVPTSGTDKGLVTERIESTTLTDCTGNKAKFEYDSKGNLSGVVNARFSSQGTPPKTTLTYDDGGRRLTVDNELAHTSTLTYDNMNKVLTAEDELGNKMAFTYDAKGKLKTVVDANREVSGTAESGASCGSAGTGDGDDDDSDTVIDDGCPNAIYNYDDRDRLSSVIDALGKTTSYAYDARGNRTSVTHGNRQAVGSPETGSACGTAGTGNDVDNDSDGTKDDGCPNVISTYNNLNQLLTQTDALGNVWTLGYDDSGRLTTRTDAKDQVTTFGYNNRGDVTSIDYPAGTTDVSFQYDGVRNRTQMVDATGTTSYSYDEVNRLTSVTFPGSRTVSYTYSNAGNRATITYPGGSNQVSYGYDAADNLTSVTDWNSNQTSYAYNDAGMLTTATLPSGTGVVGTYSYDNADRLTGISWVKGGSQTLASASYTLDAIGNRKQRVDGFGTQTYGYDALYRLTSVDYPTGTDESFTYDAAGNRLTRNSTSYTYDAADRMTAVGSTSYGYDDNGNLTSRASDSFSWDAENRMTSATVSSTTTTFAYNGNGLRDSLTTGGNTTTFTWDIAAGIPQVLDDGAFKYIYGLGRIAEVSGSNTYYYLRDGLGSVMALCNRSGTVLNSYEYDVFGAVRSSTGSTANAFAFTGEQTDASTGLEYLRARYYDSAIGRFISRDPLGGGYAYGANNPARIFDPSGLYPICGAPSEYGPLPCFDSTEVNLPAEAPLACSGPGGTGHCVYPDASVYLAGGSENIYEGVAEFWIPPDDGNGTPTGGTGSDPGSGPPSPQHGGRSLTKAVIGAVIIIVADVPAVILTASCVVTVGATCAAAELYDATVALPVTLAGICLIYAGVEGEGPCAD